MGLLDRLPWWKKRPPKFYIRFTIREHGSRFPGCLWMAKGRDVWESVSSLRRALVEEFDRMPERFAMTEFALESHRDEAAQDLLFEAKFSCDHRDVAIVKMGTRVTQLTESLRNEERFHQESAR